MAVLKRNNVHVSGEGSRAIVLAHGDGCDQVMWRRVAPAFEQDFRVVLFDHLGAGHSDVARRFARVTFVSDTRALLPHVSAPADTIAAIRAFPE